MKKLSIIFVFILFALSGMGQKVMEGIPCEVDFSKKIRTWDGFGFNYVESAQTMDYKKFPQDYGGFSILDESSKQEIVEHVFGEDGLKVGVVKLFLDPWHQKSPDAAFDHKSTTANMREFVRRGLEVTHNRGGDLEMITTLYGPPAWATQQKYLRGRDLDPKMKDELANYMIDWAAFLVNEEKFPLKYISLHNEGEDWQRWPREGNKSFIGTGHDYNMYWSPEQVVDFLQFMPKMIEKAGLKNVSVTNGEPSTWFRFNTWGYAYKISDDKKALNNLGLITSHGFFGSSFNYWYGDHSSMGIDLLRKQRPELHAWVTSSSWANMDVHFIREIYGSIYFAKVNAFIPWAGIQRPVLWVGGDPNPGNAIQINENGTYELRKGFYFYKQVSRAGQPGMAVARTTAQDTETPIIAFSSNKTGHPDAFVVLNTNTDGETWGDYFSLQTEKDMSIEIKGTKAKAFRAYRTDGKNDFYKDIGIFEVKNGKIKYTAPMGSVTTFFEVK